MRKVCLITTIAVTFLQLAACAKVYAKDEEDIQTFSPDEDPFAQPDLSKPSIQKSKPSRIPTKRVVNSTQPRIAGKCLEVNNSYAYLSQYKVYNNGRLRMRIDGWFDGKVQLRSNSAALQGIHRMTDPIRFTFLARDVCPGWEVIVKCEYNPGDRYREKGWACDFSEF